ncbi:MAG: hypothetical protein K0S61_907 [Anaerocolumna sp.]|jgi:transcriptional regulator with XRE-family HTH domain|nr:hypothetical protein [Anaerocolumna sp.]
MDYDKIGKQITLLRKEKGLTAEKLAELLSVTPQAVSKWENGKNLPETSSLPILGQVLNCSIDTILNPKELQILSAVVTDGETSIDVTKFISGLVHDNKLNIIFNSRLFPTKIEGNKIKVLTLKYQTPDGYYVVFITENGILNLDVASVHHVSEDNIKIIGAFYGNESAYLDSMTKVRHYDYFNWKEIPVNHELFPSSTENDEEEYLLLIYISEGQIYSICCKEGESLTLNTSKNRFVVNQNNKDRLILENIPKLSWDKGMDCTWAGALTVCMNYLGETYSYEYIMGVSGAGYRLAFTPVWDYSSVDALVAFDYAKSAFRALGYEHWWADRIDKSKRTIERNNIMKDLQAGKPVIAINLRIAPEWGLITGYTDKGKKFLCRTYFDQDIFDKYEDQVDYFKDTKGYLEVDCWPFALEHIGNKIDKPDDKENLYNSLRILVESHEAKVSRNYYQGAEAYEKWIEALKNEVWFEKAKSDDLIRVLSVNDYQLKNLLDARKCAANYIKDSIMLLEGEEQELLIELSEKYMDIYIELNTFYEKLKNGEDTELFYNVIQSKGVMSKRARTEQITLLNRLKEMERQAAILAKGILDINM